MKFIIKTTFEENIYALGRKIGYLLISENPETKEANLVRPLERTGYPRFHLYLKREGENLIFNLHLDQRKTVYNGVKAHSADYEGPAVEKEAERIKEILKF